MSLSNGETQDNDYAKVGAWFLGPKAENLDLYRKHISETLEQHSKWRRAYCPEDEAYVTDAIREAPAYQNQLARIDEELSHLVKQLRNSQPFFSSRYQGHMNWDTSMVGALGYFAAALWNPNNVATEGSPVTTALEIEVGKQLCEMLGYNVSPTTSNGLKKSASNGIKKLEVISWGHVTSCGSIANTESLWAARSLRYLPLALKDALKKEGDLKKWKTTQMVLANGKRKCISDICEWDLLNVPADNVLAVYLEIAAEKKADDKSRGINNGRTLESYVQEYDISFVGLAGVRPGCFMVPATRHYSWDKAGAVLGIGQGKKNMRIVDVDCHGRMKIDSLKKHLHDCLDKKIPVISVVAVVGTTAEGAVDPVDDIWNLREEFRNKGLDFFLHADAAWGGYMCSMLAPEVVPSKTRNVIHIPHVPIPLSEIVTKRLHWLRNCDGITIDPHKSGYIQYPAGALCYRNGATRFLLNFTAPILFTGADDPSVGLFGLEGSKPGAAVAATYLHHKVVGLNPRGHGLLLGQANLTTKIIYCVLYTLASSLDPFRVATYQPLPQGVSEEVVKKILELSTEEIRKSSEYMKILSEIGPDMLINGMAINFKWPLMGVGDVHSKWNTSTDLANKVVIKMSVDLNNSKAVTSTDVTTPFGVARKKLYMIRNTLAAPQQSEVAEQLRRRVGLDPAADQTLNFMVSTNMDPWPVADGFLDVFRHELRQSILRSVGAVMEEPHLHGFVVTDAGDYKDEVDGNEYFEVFGDHLPVFSEPQHQYHIIIKTTFESAAEKKKYLDMVSNKSTNPSNQPLIFGNNERMRLEEMLRSPNPILMDVYVGFPSETNPPRGQTYMRITDIVRYEHFEPAADYPKNPEYFLYGNQRGVCMSHCMSKYPDYHHVVSIKTRPVLSTLSDKAAREEQSDMRLEYGTKIKVLNVPGDSSCLPSDPALRPYIAYEFSYIAEFGKEEKIILTIGDNIWYDTKEINMIHMH